MKGCRIQLCKVNKMGFDPQGHPFRGLSHVYQISAKKNVSIDRFIYSSPGWTSPW